MQAKWKTLVGTIAITTVLAPSASIWISHRVIREASAAADNKKSQQSGAWNIQVGDKGGETDFNAIGHPSALQIHGKGEVAKGNLTVAGTKVQGKVTFPLQTLDTGISLRNTHMREKYLETNKYPNATLEITKSDLPSGLPAGDFKFDNVPFEGMLTIKNVTKPTKGTATLVRKGDEIQIEAKFDVNLADYPIGVPSFAGVSVANNVKVDAKADSKIEPATG